MNNYVPPLLVTLSSGFVSLATGGQCVAPPLHTSQYDYSNPFARSLAFTGAGIKLAARKTQQYKISASAKSEAALNRIARRMAAIQRRESDIAGITRDPS